MRLLRVQEALKQKRITYTYSEEDGCGSLDFLFRGLGFHVWEYHDGVWGVETNVFNVGRSQDLEGDYETVIVPGDPFMAGYDRVRDVAGFSQK